MKIVMMQLRTPCRVTKWTKNNKKRCIFGGEGEGKINTKPHHCIRLSPHDTECQTERNP